MRYLIKMQFKSQWTDSAIKRNKRCRILKLQTLKINVYILIMYQPKPLLPWTFSPFSVPSKINKLRLNPRTRNKENMIKFTIYHPQFYGFLTHYYFSHLQVDRKPYNFKIIFISVFLSCTDSFLPSAYTNEKSSDDNNKNNVKVGCRASFSKEKKNLRSLCL